MENQNFQCEVCSQTFTQKKNFERHIFGKIKKCSDVSLKKECTVCRMVFSRNENFRRHEKRQTHLKKVGIKIMKRLSALASNSYSTIFNSRYVYLQRRGNKRNSYSKIDTIILYQPNEA